MLHFSKVYLDAKRIHLMSDSAFHGKVAKMTQERAIYRIQDDRPRLAGVFEQVLQRVTAAPTGQPGRILAAFAASLLDGEAFNLAQIEQLPDEADRLLCLALVEYCMAEGLSEDERRTASAEFAPFVEIHESGTRH